jgi:hypothetical protein
MAKFRTFGIKVPKQTRSREIPDEKKASYRSPLTSSTVTRHLDFRIQEIPKTMQLHKLQNSLKKQKRHLKNLIMKRGRFSDASEQASYYEVQIKRAEEHIFNKEMKIVLIGRAVEVADKRKETQKENERISDENRKKNLERARKFVADKAVSGATSNKITKADAKDMAEALFLKKEKVIRSSSGSKKIVRNRHKTFSKI